MKVLQTSILILMIGLFSCEEETRTDLNDKVLVESFIYFGQQENTLQLRLFSPLSTKEAPLLTPQSAKISNISKEVEIFPAAESNGIYTLDATSLLLGEEDILTLTIEYEGQTITANTIIPSRPVEPTIDDDELKLNYLTDAIPNRINLSWLIEDDPGYYLVKIDSIGNDLLPIDGERINTDPEDPYIDRVGQPFTGSQLEISYPSVQFFGEHRLVLFHISKDYYDLYNNPVQGSYNKLSQSIVNGLGIFTALNSDTILFNVVP